MKKFMYDPAAIIRYTVIAYGTAYILHTFIYSSTTSVGGGGGGLDKHPRAIFTI